MIEDAINRAEMSHDPFTHIELENVFEEPVYQRIVSNLPINLYKRFSHPDMDYGPTRFIFELTNEKRIKKTEKKDRVFWTDLSKTLRSDTVKNAFFEKFNDQFVEIHGPDYRSKIRTDVMQCMLIRDTNGYRILPHPDSPVKILTAQIYLPLVDEIPDYGTNFHSANGEIVKTIRFRRNCGYAFVRSEQSIHSVSRIRSGDRDSLMIRYYLK